MKMAVFAGPCSKSALFFDMPWGRLAGGMGLDCPRLPIAPGHRARPWPVTCLACSRPARQAGGAATFLTARPRQPAKKPPLPEGSPAASAPAPHGAWRCASAGQRQCQPAGQPAGASKLPGRRRQAPPGWAWAARRPPSQQARGLARGRAAERLNPRPKRPVAAAHRHCPGHTKRQRGSTCSGSDNCRAPEVTAPWHAALRLPAAVSTVRARRQA